MKITTKEHIINLLKVRGLTSGTELESHAQDWGTKASVISRRARELVNEGKLERFLSERKTVQYRIARLTPLRQIKESISQESLLSSEDFQRHYNPGSL